MGKHAPTPHQHTEPTADSLKAWRERMGYSQRDACEQLGCSRTAYGRWESGIQPVPRYIGLACAALAMGMDSNDNDTDDKKAA